MLPGIFLFTLLTTYCHKDTINQIHRPSEYFPNKVRDYGEYEVYDSSQARGLPYSNYPGNYTVKIYISGIKKLADGNDATECEYEYPWGKELNYIRISGDIIKIYDTVYSATIKDLEFSRELYIFPCKNNQTWNGKLLRVDNYSVGTGSTLSTN